MFITNCFTFVDARVYTVRFNCFVTFANSRANNSDSSGPIKPIIKLIRDLMVTYILTKFDDDWLIFVDARLEWKQSQIQQFFQIQGQITQDVLV